MRKLYQSFKAPSLSPSSHQVSTYLDKQQRTCEQFYLSFPRSKSRMHETKQRCNFSSYNEQVSEQQLIKNQFKYNNQSFRIDNEKHKKQIEILNDHVANLQKDLQIYKNQQINKFDSDNHLLQGYQKQAQERKAIMKKLYGILKLKEQEIEELNQSYKYQIDDMNNKMIQLQENCNSQLFQQEDKIKQLEQIINNILYQKQSKLQELENKEQKMKDILQKLIKKQESKDKIDEVKNIINFIYNEKQKYQFKLPDQQQNNLFKEYQIITTQYESLMMQIHRLNQLICQQIKPEFICGESIYYLSQNIKEVLQQNNNLCQQIKEQKEQQNKQINKLEKYKKQIVQKNEHIEQLKMDIKNINIQLQNQETKNESIKIQQQQQIQILQQQNIESNKILEQNEQILINQQDKENQLLQEIKMIKSISLQQDQNNQIKYKNIINDLHQQIDDLNTQLDIMETEQSQLQQQFNDQEIEHKKSQISQKNIIQKLQLEVQNYQQQVEENKQQFNQQIKFQQQQHKQIQQELINNQNQLNEYLQIIENLKNKDNLNSIFENLIDNLNIIIKQKLLQNLKSNLGSSPISKISSPTRQIYNNQIDIQKINITLDNISEQFQNRLNLLIKKDENNQELIQHYCKQIEESQQTIQQLCDENDQQKQFITQMCKHLNIEKIQDLQSRKSSSKEEQSYIETLNQNNTQIQHLISYNQQFQYDIQQQQIIIKDYEIQIDHLQNQINYLNQEKEEQSKHNTQISSTIQYNKKDSNIKILQNEEIQNNDKQILVLKDQIYILNNEISNLEHQLDSQFKLVQSRNEEIQNLNSQLRDLEYFKQLLNELNTYYQQFKNQEDIQIQYKIEGVSQDISHNNFNDLRTPINQIIDKIKQEQSQITQINPNTQIKQQIIQLNKQQEEYIIQKNQLIQEQEIHLEKQNEELNKLKSINEQEIFDLHEKIEILMKNGEQQQKTLIDNQQKICEQNKEIKQLKIYVNEYQIQISQQDLQIQNLKEKLSNLTLKQKKLIIKTNSAFKDIKIIQFQQSEYIKAKLLQEQYIFKQNYLQIETTILEIEQINQKKIKNDQIKIFQFVQQNELFEVQRQFQQQQNLQLQDEYQILKNSTLEQSQFIDQLNIKLKLSIIQLEQKDKQLKQIEIELQEMSDQKELTNQNINTLQLEITQLKYIMNQQLQDNNLIYKLNKENSEKEQHLEILQYQLQDLQVKYEDLIQNSYKNEQSLNIQILDKQSQILQYESKLKVQSENLEINQSEYHLNIDIIQKENLNLKEKDQYNIMKIQQLEVNQDIINKKLITLKSELIKINNELQIKIKKIDQINQDDLKNEHQISQDIFKDNNNNICEQEIIQLKQTLQQMDNEIIRVNEQLKTSIIQNKEIYTQKIIQLESQLLNLEKENILFIDSNENYNREQQNYIQHHIKQEMNNQKENIILQQETKIQQLEIELQREYERQQQKQDLNDKQIEQLINEKNEQISQFIINNENLVQQIKESQQMDKDKLKSILNTQLDQIGQLEKTIKQYQKQLIYVNSEKEIIILSFQEQEKKIVNLIQQNEKYQIQIQQQKELIQQQQQQFIILNEDLKQKTNTITDLQNQLFQTNKLSQEQEEKINQIQNLYQNQFIQISELNNNLSEFKEKEILNYKINEELKNQLQNELSQKEKLKFIQDDYEQEIVQINQEKQDVQNILENTLKLKQQLEEDQTQKINQMTLKYEQQIQKFNEEQQQNQLIIQIQQEKQQQNNQIVEINKVQDDLNDEMNKNQSLKIEQQRFKNYQSQINLDKELINDIQQMGQLINCNENKSIIQENSDRQQCVSVLYAISENGNGNENGNENQIKTSCNQNQKIIVIQNKITQLYDENDELQNIDNFKEMSESELIIQVRQDRDNLKENNAQGNGIQQEIVKLEKRSIKKDEEIQYIDSQIYIEMCEKAIVQNRDWIIDLNSLDERYVQRWRIICNKLVEYEQLQEEVMKNKNEIQELQFQIKNKEDLSLRSIIVKQSQSFDDEDIFSIRSTVSKLRQELDQEKSENIKLKSYLKSYLNDEQRFEEQNQRVKEENKYLRNRIYDQQEEIKQLNEKIQNCQDGALASHLISLLIKFFESLQKENKQEIQVYYQSLMSICRIEYNEKVINKLFQCVDKKSQGVLGIFRRDKTKDK